MGSTSPIRGVWGAFRGANARLKKLGGAVAVLGAASAVLAACGGGGYARLPGTPYVADVEPTVSRPAFARAPGAEGLDDRSGPGLDVAPDETPAETPAGGAAARPADDLVPEDEAGADDVDRGETDLASPTPME